MRQRVLRIAAAALCLMAHAAPSFAETPAPGIADEGARDPSLVAVRQRLIRIFENGTRAELAPYLHPRIVVGTGVIGPQHVGRTTREDAREYALRLRAGGRFARPGLFFVFYDAEAQRAADFHLDDAKREVHSLHGLTAVRARPSDTARKLNEYGFEALLLPSPPGTPADWVYVEAARGSEWSKGYVRKRDIASSYTDATLILLKLDGRWWIVRMCLC